MRAQAMDSMGNLVDDFVFDGGRGEVCPFPVVATVFLSDGKARSPRQECPFAGSHK